MSLLQGDTAFLTVTIMFIFFCLIDRFLLKRGRARISKVDIHDRKNNCLRFALNYSLNNKPMWSELRYSLIDADHPTTVISGKTRGLDFSQPGDNSELLLFKENMLSPGRWNLHVKVTTTATRANPFYTLFPITESVKLSVEIPANVR